MPATRGTVGLSTRALHIGQRLLAPRAQEFIAAELRAVIPEPRTVRRALDVGCGPASSLQLLDIRPVVLDMRMDLVRACAAKGGMAVCGTATALPFADGTFDLVWSCGLLHHLDDEAASRAVAEMQRVRTRGGSLIIFDAVLPRQPARRPLATLIRAIDRGRWMRRQQALERLLATSAGPWSSSARLTYSATGLEGLLAVWRSR
jgi:SAM-dependent methyltransferase